MAFYYFDSSAVVKRYTNETGTAWVIRITDPPAGHFIYLARITGVEAVSALTRQARAGRITAADAAGSISKFRYDFTNQYRLIELTPTLTIRAMALAETHALRAYDAVQLAAALTVNDQNLSLALPRLTLISSDAALNSAAATEGLAVDDPINHP